MSQVAIMCNKFKFVANVSQSVNDSLHVSRVTCDIFNDTFDDTFYDTCGTVNHTCDTLASNVLMCNAVTNECVVRDCVTH